MAVIYKHFLANITIIEVQNCFGLVVPEDFPIIWISNLLTMSLPDEWHSRNTMCAPN